MSCCIIIKMRPHFSVVIPAFNEEKLLPLLLESLDNQSYIDFEVILVDANSTDRTIEEAKNYIKKLSLTIFSTDEKNVSASRNFGASKAKGEFLFFIDADNYVHPAFLKDVSRLLEKGYQMIVPSIVPDSKNALYKFAYKVTNSLVYIGEKVHLSFSTGGNMVIAKEVFEKLHGFDKTIFVGEDHDIVERARKKGFKVTFTFRSKVVFSVRRLEKEGGAVLLKYFFSTVYIVLFGKMTRKMYNYEMGGEYYKKES